MALVDEIPAGSRLALDSSVLIYFIEHHPGFRPIVRPVFQSMADGLLTGVVSVVVLLEVLVAPLRAGQLSLAQQYRRLLSSTVGLTLAPVTSALAEQAASIRAAHNLRVADALIAATAISEGCSHLIANDQSFNRVPDFHTIVVADFTA